MPSPPRFHDPRFHDHFSGHAADYSQFRPEYPEPLFAWLATQAPATTRAWDCATGNGQAALALAQHFAEIVATDASAQQIASATPHPRVSYAVQPAAESGFDDHSVDLVTIAQALHWIDPEPFHRELRRVLRPGGVVAAWCYELFTVSPAIDAPMLELYHEILGEDWPPERRHIETGYREINWPWSRQPTPGFQMQGDWSLERILGYLRTWSATRRWQAREGTDPVAMVEDRLRAAWGTAPTRPVHWPLQLLVSRVAG